MADAEKRRKLANDEKSIVAMPVANNITKEASYSTTLNDNIVLHFVPARIQKKRLQIIKECARKHQYKVDELPNPNVTHLITEFDSREQVLRNVSVQDETWAENVEVVSIQWFTDSIKTGSPIPASDQYRIKSEKPKPTSTNSVELKETDVNVFKSYICQRKSLLKHHNHTLTDAVDLVAKHAELRDDSGDYPRALAFRKASAALKGLPFKVTQASQITKLKDIGKHSMTIIQEILEDGFSAEVDQLKNDAWFKTIELFSTVYGVGPAFAKQWYSLGLRTLEDVINKRQTSLSLNFGDSEKINYGLAFHEEMNTPLQRAEADIIFDIVKEEAEKILPGVTLEVTGGFRRGKPAGHDVDILISHPQQGKELGLLRSLHEGLIDKGFILSGYVNKSTFVEDMLKDDSQTSANSTMDHFEKCFYIFRLPIDGSRVLQQDPILGKTPLPKADFNKLLEASRATRNWRAVRVDLIVCPTEQYAYGLVGWTGNKQFNRSIRNYSKKVMNMKLSSHGLWAYAEQRTIPASTEQEVFANLNLKYLEPWERNA